MTDYLYRYDDVLTGTGSFDLEGDYIPNPSGGRVVLSLRMFEVIRYTPKGAWIKHYSLSEKYVSLTAKKKFACRTEVEALESLLARKRRQCSILAAQLKYAEQARLLAMVAVQKCECNCGPGSAQTGFRYTCPRCRALEGKQ